MQLERALAVVRAAVAGGTLAQTDYWPAEQPRFDQPSFTLLGSGPWPDVFAYYFRCVTCAAVYGLCAETYHGSGGQWRPVEHAP